MPERGRGWGIAATVLLLLGVVLGALGLDFYAVSATVIGVGFAASLIIEDIKEG
jgi:hypothetical protein